MINIKNSQRKISINVHQLEADAQLLLEILGYKKFDVGIWITTNKTIRYYNKTYRHKDKPTDILSFPFHPELQPGQKIKATSDDDKNLGDMIISAEYVVNFLKKSDNVSSIISDKALNDRFRVLLVHGICHLLGYDHITDEQFAQMQRKEKFLLKKLKN